MIRGGDGKLKGKRNRRAAQSQFYVWKRIRADITGDWRFIVRLVEPMAEGEIGYAWPSKTVYMNQGPLLVQWSAAQDHTKW